MSWISNNSVDAHCGMMSESGGVTSDFTVMARFNFPSLPSTDSLIFDLTNSGGTNYIFVVINAAGSINIQDSSAHSQTVTNKISANTNYHVAVVHTQGTSSVLYFNGTNIASITGITYQMDEAAIAASPLAPDAGFKVNYPKTWTRALSPAEVSNEVNNLGPQTTTSIWDWWILNSTPVPFLNGQINGSGRVLAAQPNETYFTNDANTLDPDSLPAQACL